MERGEKVPGAGTPRTESEVMLMRVHFAPQMRKIEWLRIQVQAVWSKAVERAAAESLANRGSGKLQFCAAQQEP